MTITDEESRRADLGSQLVVEVEVGPVMVVGVDVAGTTSTVCLALR